MSKRPRLVKWKVSRDTALKTEVDTIALVDYPAIEADFVKLSKVNKINFQDETDFEFEFINSLIEDAFVQGDPDEKVMARLKDKNLLAAPIMIANKPIYRVGFDWDGLDEIDWELPEEEIESELDKLVYEYYGFFDEDAVRNSAYMFQEKGYQNKWNLMHDEYQEAQGVSLVESWVVEDPYNDKSNSFGYILNPGSWFGLVQIDNQALYDEYIETGQIKGVSVEAWTMDNVLQTYEKDYVRLQEALVPEKGKDLLKKVLSKINKQ